MSNLTQNSHFRNQ